MEKTWEATLKLPPEVYQGKHMEPNPKKPKATTPLTDAELFQAMKTRQTAALGMLYDRYGSLVYGIALKILKNSQEAEDLTQEIFLALWRNVNYNPEHFIRYLVTMTRTRAIDKIRARGRNLKLLIRSCQTEQQETSVNPLDTASLTERSQYVRSALAELPKEQRQVIEMAYDEGLSQSEITQQLNIPLGTVKSRTRQGLQKLKQILHNVIG